MAWLNESMAGRIENGPSAGAAVLRKARSTNPNGGQRRIAIASSTQLRREAFRMPLVLRGNLSVFAAAGDFNSVVRVSGGKYPARYNLKSRCSNMLGPKRCQQISALALVGRVREPSPSLFCCAHSEAGFGHTPAARQLLTARHPCVRKLLASS